MRTDDIQDGRARAVVEGVRPEVDAGRFPAKRIAGEDVVVEADAYADGHDAVRAALLWKPAGGRGWSEVEMEPLGNDRWRAAFPAAEVGTYVYTVEAWVDAFGTWRHDLAKRVEAGQDLEVPLEVGARLLEAAAGRAAAAGSDADADRLESAAARLRGDPANPDEVLTDDLLTLADRWPDRSHAVRHRRELEVVADRPKARFSAWYELFPRSTGPAGEHGTFRTAIEVLPYVAGMGFDVVYLPPIHPIGRTKRKGPNNAIEAGPDDPGSPWAIGAAEGGHDAVHPALGTLADFDAFVDAAASHGLEVALDVAFQCAPDHPWVAEHPEWFRHRPDGSIQYAENPPKKYEDIVPFDFETEAWRELWEALKGVFDVWLERGVRIFRVDNPHTKPFAFWEWTLAEIRAERPDAIFLAEAFTRPKVMYRLAKAGFTQSYTYFAWRTRKWELESYLVELSTPPVADFFRPNFWPNTPDILTETLQRGGRGAFMARLVLAATMASSYGIYGPAFELMESDPHEPGSEEYLHSEKYEIRDWGLDRPDSLAGFIGRVNRIRRDHPALHRTDNIVFHPVDDDALIAYSKVDPTGGDRILTVVSLDPHEVRAGTVDLRLEALGLEPGAPFGVVDLLGGTSHEWSGPRNYVELDPRVVPAHVFRIEDAG